MPSTHATPRRLGRRPVLDGLRGIAILLVMLMHTGLLLNGYIGVDLFFGLSGFLITTLLLEEWHRSGTISFRRFYERRARRLLPGLLVLVGGFALIYLVFHPFTGWPLGARALTTLLFVNNWVATLGHSAQLGALNPTWSLAVEDQFYLLWPVVLWLLLRRGVRPGAIVCGLLVAIVALVLSVPTMQRLIPNYSLYYSPPDRAAELLLGCAAAILWRHRLTPSVLHWRATGYVLIAGIGALLFVHPKIDIDIYFGAALLGVPLIINLLERDGLPARIIGCRPLRYVGRISYGLYLFNLVIHNLLVHYFPGYPNQEYAPAVFVLTFVAAALSWWLLESRVLAGGRAATAPRIPRPARRTRLEPAR